MLTIILLIIFGLPLLLLALLFAAPRITIGAADKLIQRSLKVEAYNSQSAYSGKGFAPQHTELSHAGVDVEGRIPEDLSGVYLRNGTNTQFEETNSRMHMFNGAGMLHQIQILDGHASYSNTYVRTSRFESNQRHGRELYPEFGDIAGGGKAGLFKLILGTLKKRNGMIPAAEDLENGSSTTAIQKHGGKLYCLQETTYPFSLNVTLDAGRLSLDGSGEWDDFNGELSAPFTAHPKIDPKTQAWYTFSTDLKSGSVRYAVLDKGQLSQNNELAQLKPAIGFLHDGFLTESHTVFPDSSLRFNGKEFMGEHKSPFYFDDEYLMRFGVIKRSHQESDSVQWFTTKLPGHIWHTINAWEERREDGGTDIVLFAPVFRSYPSTVPIHSPEEPHAQLFIYRLNLDTGEVTEERQLLDHFYERPSFNTQLIGQKTRYAYLLDEQASGGIMGKGVLKYDLEEEKESHYFDYGDYFGGEALFVPKANSTEEDDGYLLDLLMNDNSAYLLILDARDLTEIAKLHLPQRVPFGVHACWLNDTQLAELDNNSRA